MVPVEPSPRRRRPAAVRHVQPRARPAFHV